MLNNNKNNKSAKVFQYKKSFSELNLLLRSLLYWPIALGYQKPQSLWLYLKQTLSEQKSFKAFWKTELLIQTVSRNLSITLHTPKVFPLVDKVFIMNSQVLSEWSRRHASTLLYSFGTGRCGFKPNETKSFIAGDTTIRAGLWLVWRNYKRLTPLRLHLSGLKSKMRTYYNRLKSLSHFYSIDDATPVPFNGCFLLHRPRKRYRYHEYNVRKVPLFMQQFQCQQFSLLRKTQVMHT